MKNHPAEEKYPLLLLYVEENGKKSDFPQRVVFADKGRGKEVIKGAAAIITQWPAQITSCWFTSITIAITLIFLTFVIFMGTLHPLINPIHPRCIRDIKNYHGNKLIHVVKQGNKWNEKQLDILKFIANTYPNFEINTIIVDSSKKNLQKREINATTITSPTTTKINTTSVIKTEGLPTAHKQSFLLFPEITSIFFRKINEIIARDRQMFNRENNIKEIDFIPHFKTNTTENLNFGVPKFTFINFTLPFLKRTKRNHPHKTYTEILNKHANIKEKKITYKDYFVHTPLSYYWPDLNAKMIIFAVRAQELWQNGGISFALPNNNVDLNTNETSVTPPKPDDVNMSRLKAVIANTKYRYELLPNENVSMDGQGLHMATRTPCHTFFGEVLMRMQRDTDKLTVSKFITDILNVFCRRGAVDSDYCKKTINKFVE